MKYWLRAFGRRLPLDRLDVPLMTAVAVTLFFLGIPMGSALIVWAVCVILIAFWAVRFRKKRRKLETEADEIRVESLLARRRLRRWRQRRQTSKL